MMFLFSLFGGFSTLTKVLTIVGVVVALYASYAVWRHTIYTRGWNDAIAAIAAQDAKAIGAAKKARSAYTECIAAGRRWSTATGECSK